MAPHANGDGKEWALTNLAKEHNTLILQNRKLNGSALQYTDEFIHFNMTKESTSYNTLRKLGTNNGMVCYDRLSKTGLVPGCYPPGNRDKNDHVFCMRFSVG